VPAARNLAIQLMRTLAMLAVLGAWTAVHASPPASPVEEQIATVVGRNLGCDPAGLRDKLHLLASLDALPSGATLRVVSVKREFAPDTWLLRLDCRSPRDCLPFDVMLHASEAKGLAWGPGPAAKSSSSGPVLAHSGDRVELVAELAGVRLRVPAVCLQSGGLGDRIRVRNLATHRVLEATVAGPKLLRVSW